MAEVTPPTFEELYPDKTAGGLFRASWDPRPHNFGDNRLQAIWRHSVFHPHGYKQVFDDPKITPQAKAAYVAGRLAKDVVYDGTRVPYWALNHPLAQASVAGDISADMAGLNPDYKEVAARIQAEGHDPTVEAIERKHAAEMGFSYKSEGRGVPYGLAAKIPALIASGAMLATSGNSDFLNLAGGGRTPGFKSVMPTEADDRVSSSPLLELGARYLFGRTGRLLDWDEFTEERPEVSPGDYGRYNAHQFNKGPLLGLVKGTTRNIDAEPEYQLMGFRVPLSAAGAATGALAGTVAGSKIAEHAISDQLVKRFGDPLKARGHRRFAGAVVGALGGAIAGNLGAKAANRAVIQPMLHPEEEAEAAAWRQQQQQLGLL